MEGGFDRQLWLFFWIPNNQSKMIPIWKQSRFNAVTKWFFQNQNHIRFTSNSIASSIFNICMYVCICMYMYVYMYAYIEVLTSTRRSMSQQQYPYKVSCSQHLAGWTPLRKFFLVKSLFYIELFFLTLYWADLPEALWVL